MTKTTKRKRLDFKALAGQFSGLNPQDPSVWPALPKASLMALCAVAVMGAAYFLAWQSQIEALEAGRAAEVTLKTEYVGKYRQAVNFDLYKQQLDEVNKVFASTLRQLPNRSQMETLITDINNAGLSHSLQFELFKPAANETKNEIYAELPISIKVTGKYHDMGSFVAEIGQLSRIVTINDVAITTPQAVPSVVMVMEATAKTYRYLDEEELAAARAAARKKAAEGAKKAGAAARG